MCNSICRISISSYQKAAEKWKKETSTDISGKDIWSSCALWLAVADARDCSACLPGVCLGCGRAMPWAAQADPGHLRLPKGWCLSNQGLTHQPFTSRWLSKCTGDFLQWGSLSCHWGLKEMWETHFKCLQTLLSNRHWSPLLPHFSMLSPTTPDVPQGVTLQPQYYASCFSNPLSHTCIWTNHSYSNTPPHRL